MERCDCGTIRNDIGQCPNCGRGHYEIDPVVKLRRRCEDALRKTTPEVIKKVAQVLEVK